MSLRKRIVLALTPFLPICAAFGQVVSVESPLVQEFQVEAGRQTSGSLTLANMSDEPASVVLYINDYFRREPGTIDFTEPGSEPHLRSNAAWVALPEPVVQLQPHERRNVGFTIHVPHRSELANPAGTFWSALLVESLESYRRRTSPAVVPRTPQFNVSVTTAYRTAIVLATTIPSPDEASVSFLDVAARQAASGHLLQIDLRNNGTSAIRNGRAWVEVFDIEGRKRAEIALDELQIMLPGNAYRREVQLPGDQFGRGLYRCLVVLDAGADSMFGTQATIRLTSAP